MYLLSEMTLKSKAKKLNVKKMMINATTKKPVIVNVHVSIETIKKSDYIVLSNDPKHYEISFNGFEMILSSNGIYTSLKDVITGYEFQAY